MIRVKYMPCSIGISAFVVERDTFGSFKCRLHLVRQLTYVSTWCSSLEVNELCEVDGQDAHVHTRECHIVVDVITPAKCEE